MNNQFTKIKRSASIIPAGVFIQGRAISIMDILKAIKFPSVFKRLIPQKVQH